MRSLNRIPRTHEPPCPRDLHSVLVPADTERRRYTYEQVAQRIEDVLGERPSLSTLRAAAAESSRTTVTKSRPRLTASMPTPIGAPKQTRPTQFDQNEIEVWLRSHPRLREQAAYEELASAVSPTIGPTALAESVRRARRASLSWRRIAQAMTESTGRRHSHQAVYKRFRHLT